MMQSTGLYGHIRSNNLKSFGLFLAFAATLVLLWIVILQIAIWVMALTGLLPRGWAQEWRTSGIVLMTLTRLHYPLIAALIWTVSAFFLHAQIIRSATGAKSLKRRDAPKLYNIVENLAITAGIPMPHIEVMETDALNAYAAGLSPNDATVAVTRGLLNTLDDRELEAVLAHEITHIRNYDTRMMVIAAVLSGAMCMVAELAWRHICRQKAPLAKLFDADVSTKGLVTGAPDSRGSFGLPRPRNAFLIVAGCVAAPMIVVPGLILYLAIKRSWFGWGQKARPADTRFNVIPPLQLLLFPPTLFVWFTMLLIGVILIVAYVIAAVARSAISRSREFMADAGAIELTKNPRALVSALVKLRNRDEIASLDACVMAMMISSSQVAGWLATHPSHEDRIAALQMFAGAPQTTTWRRRNGAEIMTLDQPSLDELAQAAPPAAPTFGRRGQIGAAPGSGSGAVSGTTSTMPGLGAQGFAAAPRFGRRTAKPIAKAHA